MKQQRNTNDYNSIENRLMRIETRVCLIMEALGLDPANTTHVETRRRYAQDMQAKSQQHISTNDQTSNKRSSLVRKLIPKITRI